MKRIRGIPIVEWRRAEDVRLSQKDNKDQEIGMKSKIDEEARIERGAVTEANLSENSVKTSKPDYVDWEDQTAVREYNMKLLEQCFGIHLTLPLNHLCPTVTLCCF
jgi:hypothetical protein